jgi:O-antigen ligase
MRADLRISALPYLGVLMVTLVGSRYGQYLSSGDPWIKGQPAGVVLTFAGFAVAVVAWALLKRRASLAGWGAWILGLAAASWVVHAVLLRVHGDLSVYTVWVVLPVLLMLWLKPPTSDEWMDALRVLGWSLVVILVLTRVLEIAGALTPFYQPSDLVSFDKEHYWLPFSGYLGVDGRWPGPFGHPGDTGAFAAFVLVIGVIVRRSTGWVFGIVAVLVLLLAGTRVAFVAAAVGVGIVLLFGGGRLVSRVPVWLRLTAVGLGLVGVAGLMLGQSTNLSGRSTNIWPAFLDLWRQDPVVGVGAAGIAANGGTTQHFVHGHNLVVDELARNGLIGLLLGVAVLGLIAVVVVRALVQGLPGPAALVSTYLVLGVTQAMNDWVNPSIPWSLLIISALLADAWSRERTAAPDPLVSAPGTAA